MLLLSIPTLHKIKPTKKTEWIIHAPDSKWDEFTEEIKKRQRRAAEIIMNKDLPFVSARKTIGKTTIKDGIKDRTSPVVKQMQIKKRELKNDST